MADVFADRPVRRLVFDEGGDVDPQTMTDVIDGVRSDALTDVVMFSHGWNNDEAAAQSLYDRWFALLGVHLDPRLTVGFVGIRWPAQLWRDEPIPDFDPVSLLDGAGLAERAPVAGASPALDPAILADLKDVFPAGAQQLDAIAVLLGQPPSPGRTAELFAAMQEFSVATAATGFNDGEAEPSSHPGMLGAQQVPADVFADFADRLADAGVDLGDAEGAGFDGFGSRLLHGAREVLRQLSYWKMKNRAGVVGQRGLGPAIARVAEESPAVRIHLIGHSFGARVVSYALAGLGDPAPSPIKSVTVMQGAYSRFTFSAALPFRPGAGALAGRLNRVNGPLTVCFSRHDGALSTFYPLASAAARDDAAAAGDALARWRAMGSHGAFDVPTRPLGPVGTDYPFQASAILNLDASDVVKSGDSPSGAHSDIFHPELAWVAAAAGGLIAD